jgi:hypothetical protein
VLFTGYYYELQKLYFSQGTIRVFVKCVVHRIIRSLLSCDEHRIFLGASNVVLFTGYY